MCNPCCCHDCGADVSFRECPPGIFVTLNPAGKDYGGRSQIPDNLKALFRPVAMGRPDNELIAEVYLRAEGFRAARSLAVKIVCIFILAKQSLTAQRHYDWGLRALKAVLNTAGKIAVAERVKQRPDAQDVDEAAVVIAAIRVNTLSKLTTTDVRRFLSLVGDAFPGVASSDAPGGDLEGALRDVLPALDLEVYESQLRKMHELREALDQRMGCVVVGPSGAGKTTIWRTLEAALGRQGELFGDPSSVRVYGSSRARLPRGVVVARRTRPSVSSFFAGEHRPSRCCRVEASSWDSLRTPTKPTTVLGEADGRRDLARRWERGSLEGASCRSRTIFRFVRCLFIRGPSRARPSAPAGGRVVDAESKARPAKSRPVASAMLAESRRSPGDPASSRWWRWSSRKIRRLGEARLEARRRLGERLFEGLPSRTRADGERRRRRFPPTRGGCGAK